MTTAGTAQLTCTGIGCRKGSRDCVYPEPTSTKTGSRSKAADSRAQHHDSSSSSDEREEEGDKKGLQAIPDVAEEEEDSSLVAQVPQSTTFHIGAKGHVPRKQSMQSTGPKRFRRRQSDTSSTGKEKSNSPTTDTSMTTSGPQAPSETLPSSTTTTPTESLQAQQLDVSSWSHLKKDIRFFLQYHQQHMTHFHYFLKLDPDDFIHRDFVQLAIDYEPLMYAVVGFAAYHHTLKKANGKLQHFLPYYSQAVFLLRKDLENAQRHTESTLMTILQLATFEVPSSSTRSRPSANVFQEYLGDWVNLIGHQRAAHQMLLELFTPETIMSTSLGRHLLSLYARFDIMAGLLGGKEAMLKREWYLVCEEWHHQQVLRNSANINERLAAMVATNRRVGLDMAYLFAKLPKGEISLGEFVTQNEALSQEIGNLRYAVQALNDGNYTVTDFGENPQLHPGDIVNPYIPGGLFKDRLWPLNYVWMDWYSIALMHKYQTATIMQQPLPPGLPDLAFEQCRILEAIDRWPDSPEGSALGAHASLGLAAVFLPKDERHTMWCRKKLAQMETMGYVEPCLIGSSWGARTRLRG